MASLAQMERDLTVERTRAGLEAARRQGRTGGRKRKMTDSKISVARQLLRAGCVCPGGRREPGRVYSDVVSMAAGRIVVVAGSPAWYWAVQRYLNGAEQINLTIPAAARRRRVQELLNSEPL